VQPVLVGHAAQDSHRSLQYRPHVVHGLGAHAGTAEELKDAGTRVLTARDRTVDSARIAVALRVMLAPAATFQ
jgi:hypothetical protein